MPSSPWSRAGPRKPISGSSDAPGGNIQTVLADAAPQDKAEVYRRLGMQLTYEPGKQVVRAEVALDPPATHAGRLRRSRWVFVAVPLRGVVRDGAA